MPIFYFLKAVLFAMHHQEITCQLVTTVQSMQRSAAERVFALRADPLQVRCHTATLAIWCYTSEEDQALRLLRSLAIDKGTPCSLDA